MSAEQTFSVSNLPSSPADWPKWRKTAVTSAIRIDGPFIVDTSEGPLRCEDGWLAVDARGYPYPIAADEFPLIYEAVGIKGRGRPDGTPPQDLEPGDYALYEGQWWAMLPVAGRPTPHVLDDRWTVEEHEDGTITVEPSITDEFMGWHGRLERGVWKAAAS